MPGKQHLRGASPKENRMYEDIKEEATKEGRYPGREKEVAARTVMKYHGEHHGASHTKSGHGASHGRSKR
jgi:hypothetical protein